MAGSAQLRKLRHTSLLVSQSGRECPELGKQCGEETDEEEEKCASGTCGLAQQMEPMWAQQGRDMSWLQ